MKSETASATVRSATPSVMASTALTALATTASFQPIVVTLQTIGGGHYDTPEVSSRAVRFEGALYAPSEQRNPGGPTQIYRFTAVAKGEAQIRIPHTDSKPAVTFTIQVAKP